MSTSAFGNSKESAQPRFTFQHFDQESDFGFENANGERIRKKKKPGRKPNPPSVQERRAQNRAAQKAFREREQQKKEEKERQWKTYSEEIKKLKKQLAISQYEAKYLKACVLHLTLASLIHRGSVPHIWTESRIIPSNSHGEYKKPYFAPYGQTIYNEAYQTPALLDMLLENQCIIDFDQALLKSTQYNNFIQFKKRTSSDMSFENFQDFVVQEVITLNQDTQEPSRCFPKVEKKKARPSSPPIQLSMPDTPPPQSTPSEPFYKESTPASLSNYLTNSNSDPDMSQGTSIENNPPQQQALTVQLKPLVDVTFEPPSFQNADDLAKLPPLQALHILRLQLKLSSILGEMTKSALLPTALQRIIPHDIRIDYVPGAAIRDRMILFQDFYNMDDCFNFLTQTTVFMGGDVRNTRNWVLGPEYSLKFWFLSHQLVDQSYDDCLLKSEIDVVNEELSKGPSTNNNVSL